ncbi:MAG: DUF547 domain-containing protein [Pikeienuella sp.]
MRRLAILVVLTALAAACTRIERQFLPEPALLTPAFARFASAPGAAVDHRPWDAFLAQYRGVDAAGVARVDYAAVTADDRARLAAYIATLEAVDPADLDRATALAYWLNLYNAVTVAVVLDHYPVASIRDISDGPLPTGPWNRQLVTVAGRPLTLNDIEHRIVRPVFADPRIHYALNCAAVGCPNLAATAWRADGLGSRLDAAERAYVNDPRGLSIGEDGRVTASKIFAWFEEDFGSAEDLIARLVGAAEPERAEALRRRGRIDAYAYDWALNER